MQRNHNRDRPRRQTQTAAPADGEDSTRQRSAVERHGTAQRMYCHGVGPDPPRGVAVQDFDPRRDGLRAIVDECERHELVFGLEIEANLVGQSGDLLAEIHRQVKHDRLVLIFDAANIVCQGCSMEEVFRQYRVMKPGLGWMHIKDYRHPEPMGRVTHVDEETLKHFVPSDLGDSGHEAILRDFAQDLPKYDRRMRKLGAPGVFLDLEPHVKGGGQFGGFSGPDGFGVALRGLMRLLDYVNVDYKLRDFDDILRSRGLK